jgi:hypothetical protein
MPEKPYNWPGLSHWGFAGKPDSVKSMATAEDRACLQNDTTNPSLVLAGNVARRAIVI